MRRPLILLRRASFREDQQLEDPRCCLGTAGELLASSFLATFLSLPSLSCLNAEDLERKIPDLTI